MLGTLIALLAFVGNSVSFLNCRGYLESERCCVEGFRCSWLDVHLVLGRTLYCLQGLIAKEVDKGAIGR